MSTVKKWVEEREKLREMGQKGKGKSKEKQKEVRLEVDVSGGMYHSWWIVPKVKIVA